MKLQKKYIDVFFKTLRDTELSLAESRVRDSFMKPLLEELKTFETDRNAIYSKFAEKKKDGTPNTDDGNFHFSNENVPEVNKEVQTLYDEEVELNSPFQAKIKEIIELSTYKPKVGEVEQIDHIISQL